jgi:hypothetical protein
MALFARGQRTLADRKRRRVVDMTRRILGALLFGAFAFGQADPTSIGKHHIGETLQEWQEREPVAPGQNQTAISPHRLTETFTEWLRLNSLDLADICKPHHERDQHRTDFRTLCKTLSAIRDTGTGEFSTIDQTGKTVDWSFADGKVSDYSIGGVHAGLEEVVAAMPSHDPGVRVTRTNEREFTWNFANGKLAEVTVTPNWLAIYSKYNEEGIQRHPEVVPAYQEEVGFLTQLYGKPAAVKTVSYHNALGAQWDRSETVWYAPDGTQIVALERTGFSEQEQLGGVMFHSKDSLQKTQPTKPNPYQ